MTKYGNNYEGGTAGQAVTAANSGGASGDAYAAADASFQYANDQVAHGTLSGKVTAPGSALSVVRRALPDVTTLSERFYFRVDTLPNTDLWLSRVTATGDAINGFVAYLNGNNQFRLRSADNQNIWTATSAIVTDTWYRAEYQIDIGDGSTNGTAHFAYYSMDSTTPIQDSGTISGLNLGNGATAWVNHRLGKCNGNSYTGDLWVDDDATWTDADATGLIGPVALTAPTLAADVTDNLARIGTIAIGGTSPYTYTITQTAGTTTAPIDVADGMWLIPKHKSDTLRYQVTVTDASGQKANQNSSVPPIPTGSVWPKQPVGPFPSSTWV